MRVLGYNSTGTVLSIPLGQSAEDFPEREGVSAWLKCLRCGPNAVSTLVTAGTCARRSRGIISYLSRIFFPFHLTTTPGLQHSMGAIVQSVALCTESAGFPRTRARVHSCREPHAVGHAVRKRLLAKLLSPSREPGAPTSYHNETQHDNAASWEGRAVVAWAPPRSLCLDMVNGDLGRCLASSGSPHAGAGVGAAAAAAWDHLPYTTLMYRPRLACSIGRLC